MTFDLPFWLAAAAACALTAVLVPLVARLARRSGFVDQPAAHKHHCEARPLLGGLALVAGIFLPALLTPSARSGALAIAGAALLLLIVGLFDDRRGVGVMPKLIAQAVAAVMVMTVGGISMPLPSTFGPGAVAVITFVWLVGVTNAFNLLDNVDGLAASVAAAASLGLLAVGGTSGVHGTLAATVFGASLGFLIFNWPPARIFMGDAGSLPLGLILASLAAGTGHGDSVGLSWLLPWLLLAVPVLDTGTVFLSRLAHGRNPLTSPGVDHLSHRLIRRGLGAGTAVVVLAGAALVGSAVAVGVAGFAGNAGGSW